MQMKPSPLTRHFLPFLHGIATRTTVLTGLLLLLALAAGGPARAQPAGGHPVAPADLTGPTAVPPVDQLIIQFRAPADPAHLSMDAEAQLLDRLSAAAGVELTIARPMSGDAYVLQLPSLMSESEAARISRDLMTQPDVVYAEPNSIMQLVGWPAQTDDPRAADQSPDDSFYADQWHYRYTPGSEEGLNLPPAWDITTGAASTVVAVIDTGIRPHGDLSGRILPGYDFVTSVVSGNDGNGRDADPFDPGDWVDPDECFPGSAGRDASTWHGTHVAGTIAANSNNGGDVAGVNWEAMILPLRVLGRCGGTVADIADAIRWAAGLPVPGVPNNPNPADVINLSLGGTGVCHALYQAAFDDLAALDVVSVVAAGNSNGNAVNFRPANCEQIITVAATTRAGNRGWYSNYGSVVEISAPGGDTRFISADGILSTLNAGTQSPGADSLAYYQGTSMAAPHVAGLASLLKGQQPDLTADQVLTILETTARDFPDGSNCNGSICGAGLADAFAALSALDVTLDAPTLVTPAHNATLAVTPALDWLAVDEAFSYQLQVATDNSFAALVTDISGLIDTDFTFGLGLADDTYWWRVRAVAATNGPWSDPWRFTINTAECLDPATPTLVAPPDGDTVSDLTPLFTWGAAANATDYEFRLGEEPDVSDALIVGLPESPQYTLEDPLVAGTTYYWMVRARNLADDCDLVSDWSVIRSVVIDETAEPPVERTFLPIVLRNQ